MTRNRQGQVLVIVAIAIFALLGLVALAVDVGYLWTIRHQLQRSADAGALAGASRFIPPDTGYWSDTTVVQPEAAARARDYASRDVVGSSTLKQPPQDNEILVSFPQENRIKVVTQRSVPLFFARILGRQTYAVVAEAVAEASEVSQNVQCVKPWGIPFPWNDSDGDGLYDQGETVYNICPDGTFIPDNNSFCQGTQIIMKIGSPSNKDPSSIPSVQQEPGHFFALDFGSGAKDYRDAIKQECPDQNVVSIGDNIAVEPGMIAGPTYQGVTSDPDSLVNQDPTSYWNESENLPESGPYGDYHIADSTWMNSPRVVRIVIYDPRTALNSGKTDIEVAALAGFWVERCEKQGTDGTVYGRFIPNSAFGEGGSSPGGGGPSLKILRLVK